MNYTDKELDAIERFFDDCKKRMEEKGLVRPKDASDVVELAAYTMLDYFSDMIEIERRTNV